RATQASKALARRNRMAINSSGGIASTASRENIQPAAASRVTTTSKRSDLAAFDIAKRVFRFCKKEKEF
ncbi:MAG: hypothetical protein ACI9OO_000877, partial [Bacteroidia bacterium]